MVAVHCGSVACATRGVMAVVMGTNVCVMSHYIAK